MEIPMTPVAALVLMLVIMASLGVCGVIAGKIRDEAINKAIFASPASRYGRHGIRARVAKEEANE